MKTKISKLVTISLFVLLSVMAIISMGASGDGSCDSPEVQQPLNEGRTNYEQFLRQIGAMRGFGIPQPWITVPEDGATVTGVFEIKGWSAIAADIPEVDRSAQATVYLYAVPAAQYADTTASENGDLSSYIRSDLEISMPVPVNQATREWSTQVNDSKLPAGEVVLVAMTKIDGLTSFPSTIKVNAPNGKASSYVPQANWPPATEKLALIVVMVKPKNDQVFRPDAVDKLQERIVHIQKYFRDISRGKLEISPIILIRGNNGQGIDLDEEDSYYADPIHELEYENKILGREEVKKNIPNSSEYTVMAVQPGDDARNDNPPGQSGHSRSWSEVYRIRKEIIGSFINIPFDAWPNRPASVTEHEIAHGLGVLRHASEEWGRYEQLPDLYQQEQPGKTPTQYPAVDYSNLGTKSKSLLGVGGFYPRDYFLMANNAEVSPCAYSQVYLGWLTWNNIKASNAEQTIIVPYLDGLKEPVTAMPRIESDEYEQSGRQRRAYYVLEARGKNGHGEWEAHIPRTGILVYKIRESFGDEKTPSGSTFRTIPKGWPRSINYKELIEKKGEWVDIDAGFRLVLESDLNPDNGHEVVKLRPLDLLESISGPFANSPALIGSVLRPSLENAPVISKMGSYSPLENDIEQNSQQSTPDLDLHAYLADGTHIGMNYETGQFENPVEGSVVSGDMSMDSEWILVPEQMAQGIRFEISSHDTQQFAEKFPEMAEGQSLDLNYSIEPAVYDETNNSIYKGEQLEGMLGSGQATNMPMMITEDNISLKPSQPFWRSPAFVMGAIAGALLIPGLGLIAWSVKGMRKK